MGHILIDYTHGEALATATNDQLIYGKAKENYTDTLKMLLNNI